MLSPFDGGIDQQKYGGGGSNQQNALICWCSGPRIALSSACNRNKELKCQTLALKHRTWGVKKHTWEYLPTKRVYGILTDWWVFLTNQKMGFPNEMGWLEISSGSWDVFATKSRDQHQKAKTVLLSKELPKGSANKEFEFEQENWACGQEERGPSQESRTDMGFHFWAWPWIGMPLGACEKSIQGCS